jgi:hypothetical protein
LLKLKNYLWNLFEDFKKDWKRTFKRKIVKKVLKYFLEKIKKVRRIFMKMFLTYLKFIINYHRVLTFTCKKYFPQRKKVHKELKFIFWEKLRYFFFRSWSQEGEWIPNDLDRDRLNIFGYWHAQSTIYFFLYFSILTSRVETFLNGLKLF